jgi:LysR family transcriptional activator of nhaA
MIPLNYHHLYYFWTVARSGSIAAATQRLYLSQPTLSGQLKQLEAALKTKLLERSRRGVKLTFEGRAVFERCERIFSEGEELANLVQNGFSAPAVMRLGVEHTVSRDVVLRALEFARKAEKTCRVTILSGEAEALAAKLAQQSLDLVIANQDISPARGGGIRSRLVSRLPVYFVASRSVKRLIRRFPADLTTTALLLRPGDNPVRKQVDQYLARKQVRCPIEADSDDVELLRRLAIEGRGVAALSALAVAPDLKSGRLVLLNSSPVGIEEQIWFASEIRTRANPAVRKALEALMERFMLFGAAPSVRSLLGG